MQIEQIYTGCLAQGAYFIESKGEAVVIDPLREIEPYLERARKVGAKIKYIFETHFHADFVSGHLDLARQTGATIVYGPSAETSFQAHIAKDGEVFSVGEVSFQLLHTPGHTLESSCYLLKEESGKEVALFSGDTLFIGDVGRPDLAQRSSDYFTGDYLASFLYDSLRNKILTLEDSVIVYPAHGAGSACGKNMSKETSDTLGNQKLTNYALRTDMTREEFIREVTSGLTPPPAYFPLNVHLNRAGYDNFETVLLRGTKGLTVTQFEKELEKKDILLLDTRSAQDFAKGFIPGAINIGLDGSFAPWAGTLIPYKKQNLLLIVEEGREEEAVTRLARIGYDHTVGYLIGGFGSWQKECKPFEQIQTVTPTALAEHYFKGAVDFIDVRKESEFDAGHIVDAINIPLHTVNDNLSSIDKRKTYFVHCATGYRSMIFISLLKARGYNKLIDISGGYGAIKDCKKFKLSRAVATPK